MNPKFIMRNFVILFSGFVFALMVYACSEVLSPATEPVPATEPPVTTAMPTESNITDDSNSGAILETRRLTLEFPPKIKADSASEIVRLTLEVDDLGNITPTAYFETNTVTGKEIQIPNLYDTHNVGVEASFDIAGVEVKPTGVTYQPLLKGKPVTFLWSMRSANVGTFNGAIFVYLVLVDKTTQEESRLPISIQLVEIEAVDFFGFSVNFVKTSGIVGSVLGVIVGFPFFDDIVKYLWNKRKKKKVKK
jgi:hypothetical protein